MNPKIDPVTKEFAAAVRQRLTSHVKKIILFGSRARGDYREGSDYDFLIVVDQRSKRRKNAVLDASVEIMNNHYALAAYILWDEDEWEYKKGFPIGLNILKEGIEV